MSEFGDVINIDRLEQWMTGQKLGSGPVRNAHLLSGGTQNYLMRFERDGRSYVLRRPPKHLRKNSNDTMKREARVLAALAGSNVPHPAFIASCDDQNIIGACFYLMEPVDGFTPADGLPDYHKSDPAIRNRMGYSLVDGILALGAIDYKNVGLEGFGKPEGFLDRQAPRWLAQLESYTELEGYEGPGSLPGFELFPKWLDDNKPADFTPGILHGDYHLANVMFHRNTPELAAIVDWELSTIGDPLIDLGWLIAGWPDDHLCSTIAYPIEPWNGFPTIQEMIDYYEQRSPRNLDAINWYGVLACFKLGSILEGTYARACAGKAPKETGDQLHNLTLKLFQRGLDLIAK